MSLVEPSIELCEALFAFKIGNQIMIIGHQAITDLYLERQ